MASDLSQFATLRRLAAKCAGNKVKDDPSAASYSYKQLGYGKSPGWEAAAHAALLYLTKAMTDKYILGKIDFKNAFNCLNREQILKITHQYNPALLEYTKTAYSAPSSLFYVDHIMSETGAQQGDPEVPPLFCDGIKHIVQNITSELNICHTTMASLQGSID